MTIITDTWQALVKRKLWPIALLLVVALAAVPFVLKSDPAPVVPAAPTADNDVTASVKAVDPVVTEATTSSRRRKVLGSAKNPFAPAPLPKAKKKQAATTSQPSGTPAATSSPATGGAGGTGGSPAGGGTGGTGVTPGTPVVTTPAPKPKTHPADSLIVRFGDATQTTLGKGELRKDEALPDSDDPLVVYLGLEKGGKVARFLLDSSVKAQGDGSCDPDPQTCETLRLHVGDTEFFDVLDTDGTTVTASYELDIVKAFPRKSSKHAKPATAAARATATAASLGAASAGRATLGLAGIARLLGHL